ncbi:AMP-binding protein [Desulfogranum marinum]|uniref:AMP-binding protein n=2 Tax=Desulfogranum marinum TaxID=453220 RepID=UPI0029C63CE0|nr:AMP-binding protein [Desulfogranum marinum]
MPQATSYYRTNGEPPLLTATIPEHFAAIVTKFPENEAVVSLPQGRRLTYTEMAQEVDRLAKGLIGMGFGKGERIGVWSTNNIEWLLLQLATATIGAILVNINPAYRQKELAYALQRSEVQGLFIIPAFRSSNYLEMVKELFPELEQDSRRTLHNKALPFMRHIMLYDPAEPEKTSSPLPGLIPWRDVLTAGQKVTDEQLTTITSELYYHDPINIQYTSGTTGFPKAVVLTHHNILNNAYFSALAMQFSAADRLCVPVPFYHCFGMVLANLLCLSVGACIVIACEHFDPLQVLTAIAQEKCTAVHGVPTMFIAQLEHPRFHDFDLTSLRTGIMAGAPCPPELMKQVINEMHCAQILIGYGETEASPITHLTLPDDTFHRRIHTVGRNLPHQEVQVVDTKTGQQIPLLEIGEICFRGYHIMQGYYGDQEATDKAIDEDGWLHSGDLGKMDKDGYVEITGRLKEMIIRGGENIYPREIEDYIFTHPKVAAIAVFGIPDDRYGEEIMAWVQPHADMTITDEEIRRFCHDKIAHYKIPRYIWFVEEFPMTVTGKIQKFKMREIAVTKMNISSR